MGSINLSVHPLFFAFGFYYALTGRIFVFIIYTVTAVLHELGHSFVASNAGYRLNKITLMPFGAVVSGDIEGLSLGDEIKVALAGPFINLAVALLFVASWWIVPETYAFTDVVAEANFTMALVNFIPVFPLDGGRVISAILSLKFGEKASKITCRVIGVVFSALLVGLFVITLFATPNYSILFFAVFVVVGLFSNGKENKYVRFCGGVDQERLKRGVRVVRLAVDQSVTIKKIVGMLDVNAVNELAVFNGQEQIALLSQNRISEIVNTGDLYSPIYKYIVIKS